MKKLTLVAAALALSASASAFAVTAQSGVYVQGVGGWAFPSKPGPYALFADGVQDRTYTFGANLGYDYAFNQNVMAGIEAGYLNLGTDNYTYSNATNSPGAYGKTQNWGYQILATGTYLMSNGFSGFAKAGAINEKTIINQSTPGAYYTPTGTVKKWVPAAVLGVGYMPMQNLNIALQYEHVFGSKWTNVFQSSNSLTFDALPNKPMTQDIISLGVSYKFSV